MERGKIYKSRTGRTRYAVVGFSESKNDEGGVQMFFQGPKGFRGLIREGSLAKHIKKRMFGKATTIKQHAPYVFEIKQRRPK